MGSVGTAPGARRGWPRSRPLGPIWDGQLPARRSRPGLRVGPWEVCPRGSEEGPRGARGGRGAEVRGAGAVGLRGWRALCPAGGWMGARAW